jgi:hypothetical protein
MLLLKDIIKMMMILPSSKQDTIDKMEDCIVEGRNSCDYNNPRPVAVKIPYTYSQNVWKECCIAYNRAIKRYNDAFLHAMLHHSCEYG